MKIEKEQWIKIIFWILILIGIIIRVINYPTALAEMNSDEIMTALNAKSIVETGKETNGISYPVYLQAWGGQSVMLLYLSVIIMKIFGTTLLAVRLPMLIISLIGMFVVYDLTKKLTNNKNIALIALGLTAISPWHMLQSIWSLDCNMFPHFLIIAIDILYTGIIKNKKGIIYVSMIFFALTLYCYGIAVYFVPLFLLIVSIYLVKIKQITIKDIIISICIFLLFSLPILTMFAINVLGIKNNINIGPITIPYYEHLSRTNDMIFFEPNKLAQIGKNILATLRVIFIQYDGLEWNASLIFGTIYPITLIFLIVGVIKLIKEKKDNNIAKFIILLWLSITIIIGIIVKEANINRLNFIWYNFIIIASIGIYGIYEKVKHKKYYIIAIASMYIILGISYTTYFYTYYNKKVDYSICFAKGFYQTLDYAKNQEKTEIYYDNTISDGVMKCYTLFNYSESKNYIEITTKEDLKEKIENINENQIIIIDIEHNEEYKDLENVLTVGHYMVIEK